MRGQSRDHMAKISSLGAAARWPAGALDMSDDALKGRARAAVKMALKAGVLVRPEMCLECGQAPKLGRDGRSTIHAHHHAGYARPLDVVWLCPSCHFKHDDRVSGAKNGRAKLLPGQVAEIRRRYRSGATWWQPEGGAKTLAREFGVAARTILCIVRRQTWIDSALTKAEVE